MIFGSVRDCSLKTLAKVKVDIVVCASGYEKRCTELLRRYTLLQDSKVIVLGFKEKREDETRKENDKFFMQLLHSRIELCDSTDDTGIYAILNEEMELINDQDHLSVVIDYSSMSRVWYAAILNWFRELSFFGSVTIFWCYVGGSHQSNGLTRSVEDVVCIPGYEGRTSPDRETVAVFGLGFDSLGPFAVLEKTEPSEVLGLVADPGVFDDYADKARDINKEFISNHVKLLITAPLASVEIAYRKLSEFVSPYIGTHDVVMCGLGPKPHVLATLLLCERIRSISNIYVKGAPMKIGTVQPAPLVVATEVRYFAESGKR